VNTFETILALPKIKLGHLGISDNKLVISACSKRPMAEDTTMMECQQSSGLIRFAFSVFPFLFILYLSSNCLNKNKAVFCVKHSFDLHKTQLCFL